MSKKKQWICPVCGHIHVGEEQPTKDCPVCSLPGDQYMEDE
tara:strand:+ start:334 stop:456 length:123 start_codon:yes stop_codon:yes gene_type:complete